MVCSNNAKNVILMLISPSLRAPQINSSCMLLPNAHLDLASVPLLQTAKSHVCVCYMFKFHLITLFPHLYRSHCRAHKSMKEGKPCPHKAMQVQTSPAQPSPAHMSPHECEQVQMG